MSHIVKRIAAVAVTAIVGMGAIAPSLAGEADIKHRQNVMKAIGAHTGAIGAVVKGEVSDNAGVLHHAIALSESALAAGTAFGPDSKGGDALPAVWDKPDEFKAAYMAFVTATGKVADAARSKDVNAIKTAFGDVGKSCGGCHRTFRAKKN